MKFHARMFIAALFMRAGSWSQPKCPLMGEYKSQPRHSYDAMLLGNKKNEVLINATT